MIKSEHYYRRYLKFIDQRKTRDIPLVYTENHHIIPKSLGGSDLPDNIITLTAREHYIAHWLLWKSYDSKKMHNAFWLMCNMKSRNQQREYTINSKIYEKLKQERSLLVGEQMRTNNPSSKDNVKEMRRIQLRGNNYGIANKGKLHSEERRRKSSESHKGIPTSDKQKVAVAEANRKRAGTNPTAAAVEKTKVKCFCEGVIYNSVTEAQKHYPGINLSKRLNNDKYPEFYRLIDSSM